MNRIGLLLYQVLDPSFLFLASSLPVLPDSLLRQASGSESIFEALLDAILLVQRQSRLDLAQHLLVLFHYVQGFVDVVL